MKLSPITILVAVCLCAPTHAWQSSTDTSATQPEQLLRQMEQLQQRVAELEQQLAQQQQSTREQPKQPLPERQQLTNEAELSVRITELEETVAAAEAAPAIRLGGAVRAQYVWEDYNPANKDRGGDVDFDLFRLDLHGEIGDVILSAQYRWFQYMNTIQHAWVGYNFTDQLQLQAGITKVPFGIMPYNSNNYFFSSNFYVGLEDDHDSGVKLRYRSDDWDVDVAFFKNDEQGGIDGSVSNRFDRYAYDPVGLRFQGEGTYDNPTLPLAESNSWALRAARKYQIDQQQSLEWGLSGQFGNMVDAVDVVGDRSAWAAHAVYNFNRWTFMAQLAEYNYDIDMAHTGIVVGAYAFYDTIPSKATLYTANLAYSLPVDLGPITNLTFYNDHSRMTNKRGGYADTVMNILGVAISAGGLYTYVDWVIARNQPFIGGSMVGNDSSNSRFNINFGYYF